MHFKDIVKSTIKLWANVFASSMSVEGVMCPIGQGIIDYYSIYQLLKEINYHGYILIEQERDPRNSNTSLHDVK